ncbi:MAG: hypothetical protein MUP76_00175, partial [Acidimicrobiia bacterium]|nr:hypothetical protein [Acidimicrobiia bacterium]
MVPSNQATPTGDDSLLIVLRPDATDQDREHVIERLREIGAAAHVSRGTTRTIVGAVGDRIRIQQLPWEAFP